MTGDRAVGFSATTDLCMCSGLSSPRSTSAGVYKIEPGREMTGSPVNEAAGVGQRPGIFDVWLVAWAEWCSSSFLCTFLPVCSTSSEDGLLREEVCNNALRRDLACHQTFSKCYAARAEDSYVPSLIAGYPCEDGSECHQSQNHLGSSCPASDSFRVLYPYGLAN